MSHFFLSSLKRGPPQDKKRSSCGVSHPTHSPASLFSCLGGTRACLLGCFSFLVAQSTQLCLVGHNSLFHESLELIFLGTLLNCGCQTTVVAPRWYCLVRPRMITTGLARTTRCPSPQNKMGACAPLSPPPAGNIDVCIRYGVLITDNATQRKNALGFFRQH